MPEQYAKNGTVNIGARTSISFSSLVGRHKKTTLPDPDGGGPLTASVRTYTYDSANRLLTETDALRNVTTIQYDNLGRRCLTRPADGHAYPAEAHI